MVRYTKILQWGLRKKAMINVWSNWSSIRVQLSVINKLKLLAVLCLLFTAHCLLLAVSIAAAEEPLNSAVSSASGVQQSEIPKMIIMPFSVQSKDAISGLRREILNTVASVMETGGAVRIVGIERLKKLMIEERLSEFDENIASSIGKEEGADFAILGTITKIDGSFTIDARLLEISSGKIIGFYNAMGENERWVLESAAKIGAKITVALQDKTAKPVQTKKPEVVTAKTNIISRIKITGNIRVDEVAISGKLKSKVGEFLIPDDIKDDIRAIYDMGFFDDVTADVEDTAAGVELTFIVKERPVIKKVEITGNKGVMTEKIQGIISVKANTILNRTILMEDAEKIKTLHAMEGFYLATVEPVVEKKGDVAAEVKFKIVEGDKVKVRRITIIGAKAFDEDKIKGLMDTKEVGFFSFVTKGGVFDEAVFENDLNKIMVHYYDNGYLHASITDHLVSLSADKRWFYITISLSEGEQYKIGNIDIKGDILTTKDELMGMVKITSGEIFSRKKLREDISRLSDLYGDEGYANVNITPLTQFDEKEKKIDVVFDIKKGELVYIEKINISGNVNTRDKVIRREIELYEGALFSSTGMKRSKNNLNRLGYFETVNISSQPGSSENQMVLNVDVKEMKTGQLSAGFGYSSVDKLIGTASISQSNFLGTGLKLDLAAMLSSRSKTYTLGFTEPWLFDRPISAGFDLFNTARKYPNFSRWSNGFDVRAGFPAYWKDVRGYLTYKWEDVNVKDVQDSAPYLVRKQTGRRVTSSITATLRRDTRDNAFFPTEGSISSLSIEFAGGLLGWDNSFVKYIAEGTKYFPMPWNTTIAVHGLAGYVNGFEGKEVPIYERFFLGGIYSLRGFMIRSVGPKDEATGDVIGGDKELLVNLEYLFPLSESQRIKGVVFYDAGNAYLGRIDMEDLKSVRQSAGFGVRWYSPIGPLRLEWGYVLDRKQGEKGSQWDFSIGAPF